MDVLGPDFFDYLEDEEDEEEEEEEEEDGEPSSNERNEDEVAPAPKKSYSFTEKAACCVCTKHDGDLFLCGRCELVLYCSPECQKHDYPEHKHQCRAIGKLKDRLLEDPTDDQIYHDLMRAYLPLVQQHKTRHAVKELLHVAIQHATHIVQETGEMPESGIPLILLLLSRDIDAFQYCFKFESMENSTTLKEDALQYLAELQGERKRHPSSSSELFYREFDNNGSVRLISNILA